MGDQAQSDCRRSNFPPRESRTSTGSLLIHAALSLPSLDGFRSPSWCRRFAPEGRRPGDPHCSPGRHPLHGRLTAKLDDDGKAGDIEWNFEKFLIAPGGEIVKRIRPRVRPSGSEFLEVIEGNLPRR